MEPVVPRPHDLLRLSTGAVESLPDDAPTWTRDALGTAPWVVVRRATAPAELIAVGIRGAGRSQRYGWSVASDVICETVTPETLRTVDPARDRDIPAMRTFMTVRDVFADIDLEWGPTGSVGFELASGIPTATPDSDLDLVVRMPQDSGLLPTLHRSLLGLDARVDCQVETGEGAVALAELVSDSCDVLVKTSSGPRLIPRAAALT